MKSDNETKKETKKNSFILYHDYKQHFDLLSQGQKGDLLDAIFNYSINGVVEDLSPMLTMAFSFIKVHLDLNFETYQSVVERNRINGKNGGRPKNPEKPSGLFENPEKPSGLFENPEKPKKADNDNDNDNDNDIKYIISYLNEKAGKSFRPKNKKTISLITARLKEGFKRKDFESVIDIKSKEWLEDISMVGYLRPETLFGNKFESYLNSNPKNEPKEEENYIAKMTREKIEGESQ